MVDAALRQDDRREQLVAGIVERTGVTEAVIAELVATFYGRVREDPLLAPAFATVKDWDAHLSRLCAFWSSVALMSGRYHGQPMVAHQHLQVEAGHFDRWLTLFERTATEVCSPVAAAHFIERARRIADSIEMGLATRRGEITSPRHAKAKS
jgi:hemoglobin